MGPFMYFKQVKSVYAFLCPAIYNNLLDLEIEKKM